MDGGTPFSAREVAPPARIDWPATELSKKKRRRLMKNDRVGTWPLDVNHKGDDAGKWESRVFKYFEK